jgi:hypothetical protein
LSRTHGPVNAERVAEHGEGGLQARELAPEDGGRIGLDLREEWVDVR